MALNTINLNQIMMGNHIVCDFVDIRKSCIKSSVLLARCAIIESIESPEVGVYRSVKLFWKKYSLHCIIHAEGAITILLNLYQYISQLDFNFASFQLCVTGSSVIHC